MSRCGSCPVPAGRLCRVEAGHADPHFCTLVGCPEWDALIVSHSPEGLKPAEPVWPECRHRGGQVESGEGCGCGPKHLCRRDTRVVSAADCRDCLALPDAESPHRL